jgi:predicted metalloprotease with PDZ domain
MRPPPAAPPPTPPGGLRTTSGKFLSVALAAALLAPWRTTAAQTGPDTLVYNVAIALRPAHFSVEARLTVAAAGNVELSAPASARPAGTEVTAFLATDDRGITLPTRRTGSGFVVQARAGAVRFRYRLDFENAVAIGSTGAGLDSARLYAVGRSAFVAPDPAAYRKTERSYPRVWVHIIAPPGWHVVTSWGVDDDVFGPASGDALLGATVAAAPDFRIYRDTAGGAAFVVAVRGQRYFSDSALVAVVAASLKGAAAALGPVPVPAVTYTSDTGWKGRTSGSLQGLSSVGLIWEPGELLERDRSEDIFHETLHLWFGGAMETERWWTEGVTDYYAARLYSEWTGHTDDLADLCYASFQNYLEIAHHTQLTMDEEARRGVIGDNTALLAYRKGMLAGLLLDAAIRRETNGQAGLDDVSRRILALARGRRSHAVSEAEIRDIAVGIGGDGVARTWDRVVAGTASITEAEVTDGLRAVTGQAVFPPAPAKERKVLKTPSPHARSES